MSDKNLIKHEVFLEQKKLLEEYKRIVDVSALVSIADLQGIITYVNDKFIKVSGYSREELMGQPHSIVRHPDTSSSVFKKLWKTILNKQIWQGTIKNKNKSGNSYYVKTTIAPILDQNDNIVEFISIREDVTKLTEALKNAKRLESEKKEYLNLINENIITFSIDSRGHLTSVSKAYCRISQYSEKEIVDGYQTLKHIDIRKEVARDIRNTLSKKSETWIGEIKYRAKDGSYYWLDARIFPIFDINRKKIGYTLIGQDITDKKKVETLSITDHLTGLYNRLKLDDVLNYEIAQSTRYATQFSIILVDIDHFKSINDNHGHLVGDQVIKEISVLLKSNARETDTIGRWGGEEFLIILPHTGIKDARQYAEKIRESVDTHVFPVVKHITSSFGVSEFKNGDTVDALVSRADEALYRAKSMGRNRVEV